MVFKDCRLFIFIFLWAFSSNAQNTKEVLTRFTETINRQFAEHKFDSLEQVFDSLYRLGTSAQSLEQTLIWQESQHGPIKKIKVPVVELFSHHTMARTPVTFADNHQMVITLAITAKRKLSGFYLTEANGVYMMPEYVTPLSFDEIQLEFGEEGWKLPGTLTYPVDGMRHPLVIIIHGTGPLDRDGSVGATRVYKDLAWGLASRGIAVFRYDKRNQVHGPRLFMESYQGKSFTPRDEIVDDALLAIRLMQSNSHVDSTQIFIAGHGQGGMMTPLIAKESTRLKGIILLAANARPFQDLLIEQMDHLYPDTAVMEANHYRQKKLVQRQARYAKRKHLDAKTPPDSLPSGVGPDYWNYLNQYDQVKTFQKLDLPALVLQGERDYQSTMTDFRIWQEFALKRKAETILKSYPNLNHLFISGEKRSVPAEYQQQGTMEAVIITDIEHWIKALK